MVYLHFSLALFSTGGSNLGTPKVLDGECYTMTRICGFLLINHIDGYMMLYANPFFTKPQNYNIYIYIYIYITSKYQIVADISHYVPSYLP